MVRKTFTVTPLCGRGLLVLLARWPQRVIIVPPWLTGGLLLLALGVGLFLLARGIAHASGALLLVDALLTIPVAMIWVLLGIVELVMSMVRNRPELLPRHCRNCGYDLTGNISDRCPECGLPHGGCEDGFDVGSLGPFFDESVCTLFTRAVEHARSSRHDCIGTAQVLLALLEDEASVGGQVLRERGVKDASVRAWTDAELGCRRSMGLWENLPLTPAVRAAIGATMEKVARLGIRQANSDHLLLSFLEQPEGILADLLDETGGGAASVCQEVEQRTRQSQTPEAQARGGIPPAHIVPCPPDDELRNPRQLTAR